MASRASRRIGARHLVLVAAFLFLVVVVVRWVVFGSTPDVWGLIDLGIIGLIVWEWRHPHITEFGRVRVEVPDGKKPSAE